MNKLFSLIAIAASAVAIGNLPVGETHTGREVSAAGMATPLPLAPAQAAETPAPGPLRVPVSVENYPAPAAFPAGEAPPAVPRRQAAGFTSTCGPNGCGPARGFVVRRGLFGRRR